MSVFSYFAWEMYLKVVGKTWVEILFRSSKKYIGLFQKKPNRMLRTYFFQNSPGIFHFFLLYPWKFQTKKLQRWKFHIFLLDPFEIPRPKKDPWKFHIIFSWTSWSVVDGKCKYLKLASAIFYQILISHQKIALQKLWKMLFISSKKALFILKIFKFLCFCLPLFFSLSVIVLEVDWR